jgi:uncharacterized membrane protein YkvA (DUF1232 family)
MTNTPQDQNNSSPTGIVRAISEPLSSRGWPRWLVYLLGLIGGAYILNPTMGILELIPDNLPIVGNLDEGAAMMMVLAGIVEVLEGRKLKRAQKQANREQE